MSITPLNKLFGDFELNIFNIKRINVGASGPGLRIFISHVNSKFEKKNVVNDFIEYENKNKYKSLNTYTNFAKDVFKIRDEIDDLIKKLSSKKNKIGAFGAPAKGNTMLNFLKSSQLNIVAVADNTPIKIGKLTPGTHIPIVSDKDFNDMKIDYALLLSWNYLDFFLKNSEFIKQKGKFIVPLPNLKILP